MSAMAFAQLKELTLSDAVLNQRKLAPERLQNVTWRPNSNQLSYIQSDTLIVLKDDKRKSVETLVSLSEIQKAENSIKSLFGFSWLNTNELKFRSKGDVFTYNLTTKKITKLYSQLANMENVDVSPVKNHIAFTKENNLFVRLDDGSEIQITNHSNKDIVAGQSIARNEFGITKGTFWSNSERFIAFYEKDESKVGDYPIVDITTTPASVKSIKYPMAGSDSEKPKVGIYDIETKKLVYVSPLKGEDNFLTNLSWAPNDMFVLLAEVNREQNTYWLNRFDSKTGKFENEILTESSTKWVEPEHPAFFPSNDANEFVWISEKDGFNNLYLYTINGKLIKQLTSNKFVVKRIVKSINEGKEILFTATGTSPLNTFYYTVDRNGKQTCLTLEEGTHNLMINDNGSLIYDEYSSHSEPYKALLKDRSGKTLQTLKDAPDKLKEYKVGTTEIGQIKGVDGSVLYTRLIKPSNFDEKKKYPVLIYVYGGPHAQMITNTWLDGASLWMQWMAEQGYLVFTLDNRGSAERGVAFESQIHRQLGTVELQDQLSGVDYLKSLNYVDTSRLAVHGWSFGGFMTNTMMLKSPGVFKVGVAGGPVTDWKWYEIMYGERYMDKPSENPTGYEQASLFNQVNNLKGKLLLIHGTADDVVVIQHNEVLVKKFIEAGKQVDFFPYPMHLHNVFGKDRVHLMQKVLTYIIENNK